jgi:methylamine utilization protein MauE
VSQLVAGLTQVAAGAVASFAVFLVITGLGKAVRGWRRPSGRSVAPVGAEDAGDDHAIRQALRLRAGPWRLLLPVVGCAEVVTGAVALSGRYPTGAGAATAALGVSFVILLGYARARRASGGCGCNSWRRRQEPVSWRSFLRAVLLAGAGAGELTGPGGYVRVTTMPRPWFAAGAVIAAGVLLLADLTGPVRTPVCHRPALFPVRRTLRALTAHPAFAGVVAASGPFGPKVEHRRNACTDKFWFSGGGDTVGFDVEHIGRSLAVRSAVCAAPAGPARPLRAGWLAQASTGREQKEEPTHAPEHRQDRPGGRARTAMRPDPGRMR